MATSAYNNVLIRSGEAPGIGLSRKLLYSGFNILPRSVVRRQTGFAARITRTLSHLDLKIMNTKTLFFTIALVCFASIATANDTYYLPSDSFFYFRPNIGELNSFAETESPTVPYGSHWNAGFGCGHIGYKDLMLKNLSAESKAALIQAFKQLKPKVDTDEKLGGRMSVFV